MNINLCMVGGNMEVLLRNYISLVYYSLTDLGHNVLITNNTYVPDMFHIFFNPLNCVKHNLFLDFAESGRPYGVHSTEIFTGNGYNYFQCPFDDAEMAAHTNFLNKAKFVWSANREEFENYEKITDNVSYIRYGFHERVAEIPRKQDKMIDVFFFGSMHDARRALIEKIKATGLSVIVQETGSSYLTRNSLIAMSKVNLNLNHYEPFTNTSPQRVVYLANNGICALSNMTKDVDGYLAYTVPYNDDELPEACLEWARSNRPEIEGERVYEMLKPHKMTDILAEALDARRL